MIQRAINYLHKSEIEPLNRLTFKHHLPFVTVTALPPTSPQRAERGPILAVNTLVVERGLHWVLAFFLMGAVAGVRAETPSVPAMSAKSSGARERLTPPKVTRENVERWIKSIYITNPEMGPAAFHWHTDEMKGRLRNRSLSELVAAANWAEILRAENTIHLLKTYGYTLVVKREAYALEQKKYELAITETRIALLIHPELQKYIDHILNTSNQDLAKKSPLELLCDYKLLRVVVTPPVTHQSTDNKKALAAFALVESAIKQGEFERYFSSHLQTRESWVITLTSISDSKVEEWLNFAETLLETHKVDPRDPLNPVIDLMQQRIAFGKMLFDIRHKIIAEIKSGISPFYQMRPQVIRLKLRDELNNLDSLSTEHLRQARIAESRFKPQPSRTDLSDEPPEIQQKVNVHLQTLKEHYLVNSKNLISVEEAKHLKPWLFSDYRFLTPVVENLSHDHLKVSFVPTPEFRIFQLRQILMFNTTFATGPSTDDWKVFRHPNEPIHFPVEDTDFFTLYENIQDAAPGEHMVPGPSQAGAKHSLDFDMFTLGLGKTLAQNVISQLPKNAAVEVACAPAWIYAFEPWSTLVPSSQTYGNPLECSDKNSRKLCPTTVKKSGSASKDNNVSYVMSESFKVFVAHLTVTLSLEDIETAINRVRDSVITVQNLNNGAVDKNESVPDCRDVLEPVVDSVTRFLPLLSPHPHENKAILLALKEKAKAELKNPNSNITFPERVFINYLKEAVESALNEGPSYTPFKRLIWYRLYPGRNLGDLPN